MPETTSKTYPTSQNVEGHDEAQSGEKRAPEGQLEVQPEAKRVQSEHTNTTITTTTTTTTEEKPSEENCSEVVHVKKVNEEEEAKTTCTDKPEEKGEEGSATIFNDQFIGSLIDHTALNRETDTEESIRGLCQAAKTSSTHPAAVCVYPEFIPACKDELKGTTIDIATVVNFPAGTAALEEVVEETKKAIESGATEIDLVINYHKFELIEEGAKEAEALCKAVKAVCGDAPLKVIIEAGELKSEKKIKAASMAAIQSGANMIKTSTGKVPINATPENATYMLQAITESGIMGIGFKAAGGVRSAEDACVYLNLAKTHCPSMKIAKNTFRFGSSSLLSAVITKTSTDSAY